MMVASGLHEHTFERRTKAPIMFSLDLVSLFNLHRKHASVRGRDRSCLGQAGGCPQERLDDGHPRPKCRAPHIANLGSRYSLGEGALVAVM